VVSLKATKHRTVALCVCVCVCVRERERERDEGLVHVSKLNSSTLRWVGYGEQDPQTYNIHV
jgi:hypothetical protein